jgi:hypothetical protein
MEDALHLVQRNPSLVPDEVLLPISYDDNSLTARTIAEHKSDALIFLIQLALDKIAQDMSNLQDHQAQQSKNLQEKMNCLIKENKDLRAKIDLIHKKEREREEKAILLQKK